MLNRFHSFFFNPLKGWDPVSPEYAEKYSEHEWRGVDESLLDELDRWVGGLAGKRVLDFGGGPGQYTIAFAKRGADVTWHDISKTYRDIAELKGKSLGISVRFSIGYLDDAPRLLKEPFDLVFNRICWNYGFEDRSFADVVFKLVKPGGVGYIDTNNSCFNFDRLTFGAQIRTWINDFFRIKIGHPFPPHGRVAHLFLTKNIDKMLVDYSSPKNDRIMFVKSKNSIA